MVVVLRQEFLPFLRQFDGPDQSAQFVVDFGIFVGEMFGLGSPEDLPQLIEKLFFVGGSVLLRISKFIGDLIDEGFYVVDRGVYLDKESPNITSHDLGDESLPGVFLLRFHRGSLLAGRQFHARQIYLIIELTDNFFEFAEKEFDEGVGEGVFSFGEVVFDPAESLADPDEIFRANGLAGIDRMQD